MSYITQPPLTAARLASLLAATAAPSLTGGVQYLTRAGGITIASPAAREGQPHLVVEAPPAPLAVGEIDLSITTEQPIRVDADGLYLADSIVVCMPTGDPGTATVTVTTLDAARGGGRTLAAALDLEALSDPKAAVAADLEIPAVLRAPYLYATVASPGTGTARLLLYGRIVALDDPDARTYRP